MQNIKRIAKRAWEEISSKRFKITSEKWKINKVNCAVVAAQIK